jgi:translation initiation factor 1
VGLFDGTSLERPVLCDRCGSDLKLCKCGPPDVPAESQRLRVALEKRKKGKLVTVVSGFTCLPSQIASLLVDLKNRCGAGGTCDETTLELQGDHVKKLRLRLGELKYKLSSN